MLHPIASVRYTCFLVSCCLICYLVSFKRSNSDSVGRGTQAGSCVPRLAEEELPGEYLCDAKASRVYLSRYTSRASKRTHTHTDCYYDSEGCVFESIHYVLSFHPGLGLLNSVKLHEREAARLTCSTARNKAPNTGLRANRNSPTNITSSGGCPITRQHCIRLTIISNKRIFLLWH